MAFARKIDGSWVEITDGFTDGKGDDALQYPPNWIDCSTIEERASIGIVEIVEPVSVPTDVSVTGSWLSGEEVPAREWIFDEPSLASLKDMYRARAEAIRDRVLNGGCETLSGRVDTDLESRLNISGSVQMAAIMGAAFTTRWRRSDNSYISLDAAAMSAIGLAAGQHVATCYNVCFAIKDAIAVATTRAAVRAIDLSAGYPE